MLQVDGFVRLREIAAWLFAKDRKATQASNALREADDDDGSERKSPRALVDL